MRDEPADLGADTVATLLRDHWRLDVQTTTYAPVGFGSHHWIAADGDGARWFATADVLTPRGHQLEHTADEVFANIAAAMTSASELARRGLEFVLAPIPDTGGVLVRRVRQEWSLHVHPFVSGWSTDGGAWTDHAERERIGHILGRRHTTDPPKAMPHWRPDLPHRAALRSALDDVDTPWDAGPYAEPTRRLLAETGADIDTLLDRYDTLARKVEASTAPWVITHGEPHSANAVRTADGRLYLVDWGSIKLAPRERDLANAFDDLQIGADILPAYRRAAGDVAPRAEAVRLFRLWWQLAEIGEYVRLFRHPHALTVDTAESWNNLQHYVPPAES
ncbi:MAG: phosphotransferase family protein [Actinopolymorphaceae bacterium]